LDEYRFYRLWRQVSGVLRDYNTEMKFFVVPKIYVTAGLVMNVEARSEQHPKEFAGVDAGKLRHHIDLESISSSRGLKFGLRLPTVRRTPMRWQARMFSRGRLTVPRDLLRRMGARPGDKLEFEVKKRGAYAYLRLVRAKASRYRKPF
jgi:hypothetical protein